MRELLRAAFVIARRDFSAVILSKTFILFLVGPLFPVLLGLAFGGLGDRIASNNLRPVLGLAMSTQDAVAMERARTALTERLGPDALPALKRLPVAADPRDILAHKGSGVVAVVSGAIDSPLLTGQPGDVARLEGDVGLLASAAKAGDVLPDVKVRRQIVSQSSGSQAQAQLLTGRAAQVLIFLLTMLLAGMVLSNMVEEKTNKVIEVLVAAVPVDAVFLGKLGAMLAMSFVGIVFWGTGALGVTLLLTGPGVSLPAPAVGWPMFVILGVLYFAMAYTLLGSLFLGIGAQAATVREVQTLSMPVTMAQVVIFFFASYGVDRMGQPPEVAAAIFPFSSPFAMIARAAQDAALWPHLLALAWQAVWVAVIIRIGVWLFRRHVLKSGSGGGEGRRLFRRKTA